jgi:hypothetical protein
MKCIHCLGELIFFTNESIQCRQCKAVFNREFYEQILGNNKQNKDGWIKCSKRNPDKDDRYLVAEKFSNYSIWVGVSSLRNGRWDSSAVICWQNLPEAPE